MCIQVVVHTRPKELNERFGPVLRERFHMDLKKDIITQCRDEAKNIFNLSVSLRHRGATETLTVRAIDDPKSEEDRNRTAANVRIVTERLLQIFAEAGDDVNKLTLPPQAKYRGRCDKDALFQKVMPERRRLVLVGNVIQGYPREAARAGASVAAAGSDVAAAGLSAAAGGSTASAAGSSATGVGTVPTKRARDKPATHDPERICDVFFQEDTDLPPV